MIIGVKQAVFGFRTRVIIDLGWAAFLMVSARAFCYVIKADFK